MDGRKNQNSLREYLEINSIDLKHLNSKYEKLSIILHFLSQNVLIIENETNIYDIISELYLIYKSDFRHSYYEITDFINSIVRNDNKNNYSEKLDTLSENLNIIYNKISKEDFDNSEKTILRSITEKNIDKFKIKIFKLQDHVKLEISHIRQFKQYDSFIKLLDSSLTDSKKNIDDLDSQARNNVKNYENQIRELNERIELLNEEAEGFKNENVQILVNHETIMAENEKLQKKLIENAHKIDNFNTQSIAVLSIFAGVVMAFTGGFSLLGSAFNNINSASISKLVLIISLVGFFLFNTIFVLIYTIAKVTDKKISLKCPTTNSNECFGKDSGCKNCSMTDRMATKYPYVFYTDCFLGMFILAMVVALK